MLNWQTARINDIKDISEKTAIFSVELLGAEPFDFIPGQAVNISINEPEWKNELRPFTFTNQKETKDLEFIVKIYNE